MSLTRSGHEVDFLARAANQPPWLIQVCADLSHPDTRARCGRSSRSEAAGVLAVDPAALPDREASRSAGGDHVAADAPATMM